MAEISAQLERQEVWSNHEKFNPLNKKATALRDLVETVEHVCADVDMLSSLYDLDPSMEDQIDRECDRLAEILLRLQPPDPLDNQPVFLEIMAGNGGQEACSWTKMLLRMYYKYGERHGLDMEIIDLAPYEPDGIRSVTVYVTGPKAYGLFKLEPGIHRLSRVSPFDQADRRQTSRARVDVQVESDASIVKLNERDLEVYATCGGGPGGQNVNKRHTTIIAKHLPTGISVRCQNERSQEANRKIALKLLESKVNSLQEKEREQAELKRRAALPKADFGEKSARTYVLSQHPMAKDHRTGKQTPNVTAVLEGELGLIS